MDQFNFLKMMQGIVSGDGILLEEALADLADVSLFSDGSTLTTTLTTNPGWAKAETNATVIQWAATKVVAAGVSLRLPIDYDEARDTFEFHMLAQMGGATDTPGFTANVYQKRPGSALSADLGPFTLNSRVKAVVTTAATLSGTSKDVYFDLSGKKLKGGDVLQFKLTPGAHGTDAINLYVFWQRYRSDVVSYDPSSPLR